MKNRKKLIGTLIIVIVFIILTIIGIYTSQQKKIPENDIFVENEQGNNTVDASSVSSNNKISITVEIKGEVNTPNVYILKYGSRVKDLISMAGGLLKDADISKINLAKKLKDEDNIIIPKIQEGNSGIINSSSANNINSSDGKVDINSATKEQLDAVPGIGPVTAEKIVDYREKNGPYSSLEDLKKIGGVGDKTLSKFENSLEAR